MYLFPKIFILWKNLGTKIRILGEFVWCKIAIYNLFHAYDFLNIHIIKKQWHLRYIINYLNEFSIMLHIFGMILEKQKTLRASLNIARNGYGTTP